MSVSVRVEDGNILIQTKYDPKLVETMRSLGATWDKEKKIWIVPLSKKQEVEKALKVKIPSRGQTVYIRASKKGRGTMIVWLPSGELLVMKLSEICKLLSGEQEYARARLLPPKEKTS
ncbi:MAG: hypothetical protein QW128_08855 [Thermoprotei archaeon]